jgi:hypothetical protein
MQYRKDDFMHIVNFIIKANVEDIALLECASDDQVIETLTQYFTEKSAEIGGSACWLDNVCDDYCEDKNETK